MVQCKRLFYSLVVPKRYSVNAGNSEKALHTVPKRYSVLYHSDTAKMFLQTISTAVNERKTQRNPTKPRKPQANHAKQDGAKAKQKLANHSKSYHLQPNANQKFTAQRRALSSLCYPASTSNQPQTNTDINTPTTHSFPHNGGLYKLSPLRA